MKTLILSALCLIALCAGAQTSGTINPPSPPQATVTLTWNASTSDSTNNPLTYAVWWGVSSGVFTSSISAGTNLSCTVTGLVNGVTYYFAATAATSNGVTSAYSNQATNAIPAIPAPPTKLLAPLSSP
jgi:hypothetical protein